MWTKSLLLPWTVTSVNRCAALT